MSDAAERLAQAIRDLVNDAVEAAVACLEQPRPPHVSGSRRFEALTSPQAFRCWLASMFVTAGDR
jgi:hypothetical protein